MILEALKDKLPTNVSLSSIQSETPNVDTAERIISVIGGIYLAFKGIGQIKKHPVLALQETVAGGLLIYRGATGFCPVYASLDKDGVDIRAIHISESFIVDRPKSEVYAFWRRLENLPRFMKHLSTVEEHDAKRSHWRANLPGEILKLSWNAEITNEEENAYIGWQSVEGSMVENAGKVTFHDAIEGIGTELTVSISYVPPAGSLGQGVARLLNGLFENMVRSDINNFKNYIEGEEYKTYEPGAPLWSKTETAVNSFK